MKFGSYIRSETRTTIVTVQQTQVAYSVSLCYKTITIYTVS